MKFIVWTYILISFSLLQTFTYSPDLLDVPIGLQILQKYEDNHKSLCIFSNELNTNDDLRFLNQIIKEIIGKDAHNNNDASNEDFKLFIQRYFNFMKNKENYMTLLLSYFLPERCRFPTDEIIHVSQLAINKLKLNIKNIVIDSCAEFLSFACVLRNFYRDLVEYTGTIDRKEQKLSDISVLNDRTLKFTLNSSVETPISILVERNYHFIGKLLNPHPRPSMLVTLCLVAKSIHSYKNNEFLWILENYEIIVNYIRTDETCELSKLQKSRHDDLLKILKNPSGVILTDIEKDGLLNGLESLLEIMENTNIHISTQFHRAFANMFFYDKCVYNQAQFLSYYETAIYRVKSKNYYYYKIRNIGDMVIIICIYSNIKNYRVVTGDPAMLSAFKRIVSSYHAIAFEITQFDDDYSYIIFLADIIREDSEYVELYTGKSYLNKIIYVCKTRMYKIQRENYNKILRTFFDYLYLYLFKYCPYKSSNLKEFADGLSMDLIGVRDDKISTLKNIKLLVDKFLDQSVDSIDILWPLDVFEFETESCHIKSVDYSNWRFFKPYVLTIHRKTLKEAFIPICSNVRSSNKFLSEFNVPISTQNWLKMLESSINIIQNLSYINLENDKKFDILKKSVYDSLKAHTTSQLFQMRIDCEIRMIMKVGWPHLSIDEMENIYLYIRAKYYQINPCLIDDSIFIENNIPVLVAHLKLYRGFKVLEDNKIRVYILYLKKSLPNVVSSLLSSDYTAEYVTELIDPVSCILNKKTPEFELRFTKFLQNKYKGEQTLWENYLTFHQCLFLQDITPYFNNFDQNKQFVQQEIDDLHKLYLKIISENPELLVVNIHNLNQIFAKIKLREEFKQFSSHPLKILVAKCHIGRFYNISGDQTTSTSSTESTTTSSTESTTTTTESTTTSSTKSTTTTSTESTTTTSNKAEEVDTSKSDTTISLKDYNEITKPGRQKMSLGIILGIVFGCLAAIVITSGLIIYFYKVRKNKYFLPTRFIKNNY